MIKLIIAAVLATAAIPAQANELECLAKVVHHESANQSRDGQIAVARVVQNRVHSERFPNTFCSVARQQGQFFNIDRYNPPRDGRWENAVSVSSEVIAGEHSEALPRSYFFRATWSRVTRFFRGLTHRETVGEHAFYDF